MFKIDRRGAMAAGAGALLAMWRGAAAAEGPGQWFDLRDAGGARLPNMRLPVELTTEIETLPGVVWTGAAHPAVTLVEMHDYNCPWCQRAAQDLHGLLADADDVRIGFLNNPVLSPGSMEAAKVEMALTRLMGPQVAYDFYRAMYARRRRANGEAALATARVVIDGRSSALAPRGKHVTMDDVERIASEPATVEALQAQMKLARSLGMSATPSFVIGGIGVQGYPGEAPLQQMIASMRNCDAPTCAG